ncbi:MAG: GtrA family protein [Lachnospiraceae bacterium]|nr:GtrA family protein [Lachnospiraceae bacterium]MDY3731167.1 GtrA family protein [Candidatus Choladocola sp.]
MEKLISLYKRYKEIVNYLIVGGLTTVVSLGVYYGCVLTILDPEVAVQLQAANIISWIAAVTFAYFTNRKFVFESKNENKLKEAAAFYGSRVTTLLMDMGCMFLMVTLLGWNDKIAKLIVQVIVTVANYVLSKFIVFRK